MSGRNLTNMDGSSTNVVITNRMEAQLPLEQTQSTFLDPIIIAMKGLNGFGGAGKVIKVNSSNNALEYATDEGNNWTLNGSSLYPLATSTNVLIGSTTNTNSSKFFVNGTSEFNNDVVINNGSAESRLLLGTNSFSGNGSLVVYNPSGAGLVIFSPTQGQANRISLRGTSNTGSDEARITFDPETGLLNETYLRFQYADKYFFDKQIIIDTTGAELSNGTNTYTLPSSTGTLALTSDISAGYWELPVVGSNALVPTDDDYFIQLQKLTDSTFETLLEFYNINQFTDYQYFRFSMNDNGTTGKLKFDSERNSTITNVYEISSAGYIAFNKGIEIKDTAFQFTAPNGNNFSFPTSGGSGILATTGDVIAYNKGGTGLTSLTASKFLQVNSSANGYDLVDAPSGSNWTLNNNNLYPTNTSSTTVSINTTGTQSGYVLNIQGSQYINGFIRLGGDLQTRNGTNGITYASGNIQKIVSNSVSATYSFPSSSGTFALTTSNGDLDITGDISVDGIISVGDEAVFNVNEASNNGRMGFQTFLAGFPNNIFPTLIAEQTYGYFMSNTTPITGTGGSYDGYWGNGALGNASDRRLKKNINTIENPIDIIKKLRGVNFEWICDNKPKGIQIGYIAQEVNEVIPSICDFLPTKNECCEDGTWGIQTANISSILVEGIKAQQTIIETLRTELDNYKSLMDKLINAESFDDFKKNID